MAEAEKSLRDYLDHAPGALSVDVSIPVLIDVAEALVEAIAGRVVHRDIKPENILLLNQHWCLADFGIARYAEATTAPDTRKYAMTRPYAAPEQWRGERSSIATDVYALGVVAYEALAGHRPFQGPDYRHQHLDEVPGEIPGIPAPLQSLVAECLNKAPQSRPSPQNLVERLRRSLQPASPAAQRLRHINVGVVQQQAELSRQRSADQSMEERRRDLAQAAEHSWERLGHLFDDQIMSDAPATTNGPLSWHLSGAHLAISPLQKVDLQFGLHHAHRAPFETVAYSSISIEIPRNPSGYEGRAHSLWYCDAHDEDLFRWYETAFMINPLIRHAVRFDPFALYPGDAAYQALSRSSGCLAVYCCRSWP